MKRSISMLLTVILLILCVLTYIPADSQPVFASTKAEETRAIGIVFDNSGSMYIRNNQAWSRATYAMEVFASMLNKGDTLLIYPMHKISVGDQEYDMSNPFQITDASQASKIREIYTPLPYGTPIETIDSAAQGIKNVQADQKYMIVLTDGNAFDRNGKPFEDGLQVSELDKCLQQHISPSLNVLYLGIGTDVVMPSLAQTEQFTKKQATDSKNVLSSLTEMCNQIFGRDTLPSNCISGKKVNFDISMKKLIVFVQGENVSGLKVNGKSGLVGKKQSETSTKYGTKGCGLYDSKYDAGLQGMMVTYTDCAAGSYTIEYKGTASSIEIYYEPDADLQFVFTDAKGNKVDPKALYEGDYKVSYGMKDARTGELIESDLLGEPKYSGSYFIDGKEQTFSHTGFRGEETISLKMGQKFKANLTATYLSGYTITKDSSDFGWPEGGIQVAARPAGELKLEISGGDKAYPLQDLEKGKPFVAKVYYNGKQLTGDELKKVELNWKTKDDNATIQKELVGDHYNLYLNYADANAPQDTVVGKCTVDITAFYAAEGSSKAQAVASLTYTITDEVGFQMEVTASQDYIVIKEIKDSEPIEVKVSINGKPLTAAEFANVKLDVDCGGIDYKITPNQKDSSFAIQLLPTKGIESKDYPVKVTAHYTDRIGRTMDVEDSASITMSTVPLWVKWLIGILLLILLIIIIVLIARIKRLPKKIKVGPQVRMYIGDDEKTDAADINVSLSKGQLEISAEYPGVSSRVMMDVKPGKNSYLCKKHKDRIVAVDCSSIFSADRAIITEVTIRASTFDLDETTGRLAEDQKIKKNLEIKNGQQISYRGFVRSGRSKKAFYVEVPLVFRKK